MFPASMILIHVVLILPTRIAPLETIVRATLTTILMRPFIPRILLMGPMSLALFTRRRAVERSSLSGVLVTRTTGAQIGVAMEEPFEVFPRRTRVGATRTMTDVLGALLGETVETTRNEVPTFTEGAVGPALHMHTRANSYVHH